MTRVVGEYHRHRPEGSELKWPCGGISWSLKPNSLERPPGHASLSLWPLRRSMSSSGHVWADDKADVQRNVDKTLKYSGNLI